MTVIMLLANGSHSRFLSWNVSGFREVILFSDRSEWCSLVWCWNVDGEISVISLLLSTSHHRALLWRNVSGWTVDILLADRFKYQICTRLSRVPSEMFTIFKLDMLTYSSDELFHLVELSFPNTRTACPLSSNSIKPWANHYPPERVSSVNYYGQKGGAPASHRYTLGQDTCMSPTSDCCVVTSPSTHTNTTSNMAPLPLHSMIQTALLSSECWFDLFAVFCIANLVIAWLLATLSRSFPRDNKTLSSNPCVLLLGNYAYGYGYDYELWSSWSSVMSSCVARNKKNPTFRKNVALPKIL